MKATDTFRKAPQKHNCAQAIANHWRELYAEDDTVERYAPYVGGHAPEGYCGALYAAMQACPCHADDIKRSFKARCGGVLCREIKGESRTPCEVCVDTADELVDKYKLMNNG